MIMNFEDYSLDQLTDCLFDLVNNSDIPPEVVVSKIKESLKDNKLDLQRKLDRTTEILSLFEKDQVVPDNHITSEFYSMYDGYEWTPTPSSTSNVDDKINFNKYPTNGDAYKHSEYYWDTDRNK